MLEPEEKRLQGAELAGACLLEIEKPDPDLRRKQAEELCRLIENASAQTTPLTRARAGDTLAALGDPRFKEYCFHSPLPSGEGAGVRVILPATPTLGFIRIPKGKFLMGSSEQDKDAYDVEKPQHELDLPYDYWIAKYPVTVAQWRAFVEASGYRGFDQNALRDPDNRPVCFVTWRDALAYCDWLDGVLKEQASKIEPQNEAARAFLGALASRKYRVTLPSEAEWEKAARGPIYIQQSKINNRKYPWGDTFDPNKANTEETDLGTTTAVGAFPLGLSPYGCLDMSGNVWEWTRTLWDDRFGYPYKLNDGREDLQQKNRRRVVRGGSFLYHHGNARCASRGRDFPFYLDRNRGFRVVVSPI
jgi:formylglycine-generating enzyme required for sulfatase activity